MAIEQELVDYIKKARAAGQSDGQSRSLLYRNGWTEAEVNEAFNAISQTQAQTPEGPKIQPQYQPQTQQGQQPQQAQSQISRAQSQPQQPQPQPQVQPKPEPQYSKPSYQPSQPSQGNRPAGRSGSHALLKIFVVLIMLAIIGGAGLYYVLSNGIYNPSWNPFGPNPEEVMAKMFAIMQGTELYPMKATATNGSAQADADIIASGGTLYIKFNQLSGLDLYNPDEITGKWFKLENSSIGADLNMASLKNSATFVRQLDDQVIGGQDNYHYLIRVNETDAEIWISKQDYTLYGYKAEKTVDLNQFFTGLSGQLPAKWDVQILGSVDQTPMQKPSDSETANIENVFLPILKAQKINSDVVQIGNFAESIFAASSSYAALCYKGLLNGYQQDYGDDLIDLNNDIINQGAKKPACYSSASNYCVSTQLANGSFLCVGKNASLGTSKCSSGTAECQ